MVGQLILLIILSIFIRSFFIFSGSVSFHFDMARDAFVAQQIWQDGNLKILGPPASVQGLYHGVFYYYLIAPFYALGQGDPRIAALFLSIINSLTIIPLFLLARDLFKSAKWAILASLLFTFSFEAVQYGPWISNPAPSVLTLGLFFLGLRLWQKGRTGGLYLASLMAALSVQFQFFLIYVIFLIPIFKYLFKVKSTRREFSVSVLILLIGLSNFVIASIKFNALKDQVAGFLNISSGSQIDFRSQFTELLFNYINRISELFTYNFIPLNVFLGGILSIVCLYLIRKEKFILFCLFSNLPIFIFGGHSNTYANIGLVVPAILSVIFFLRKLAPNKLFLYLIITLIFVSNIYAILRDSPKGQVILVIPNDMILKNQLSIVDKTYQIANGKPFSVNSLTLPLWTNTTWAYLYSWYGQKKYGYLPNFTGHNQIGLLGDGVMKKIDKPEDISFFIIEPSVGIPADIYGLEIGAEDAKTKLIDQITYGDLKLQIRKPFKENE